MRIAFFSAMRGDPWGGSEELWSAAAREALNAGHQVSISTFDWPNRPPQIRALESAGAHLIPRPLRPSRLCTIFGPPAWLRELERWSPDAICLSQGNPYECIGRRSTRLLLPWLERGKTPTANIIQYAAESTALKPRTRRLASRLFNLSTINAFVAQRNLDRVTAQMAAPIPRPRILQNPVNLADTSELPWPTDTTARFATVGRLHTDAKGQDLLFYALASPPWRSRDWTLDLFGDGRDRDPLIDLAKTLNLSGRVRFRGQTPDIRSIWADHHLLLLPSRNEGTALAMIEALLLGRPVVATRVGGAPDWITEGQTGFLADSPSAESISAALERAWSARPRWPDMGRAAREFVLKNRDPNPGRTLLNLILGAAPAVPLPRP